MTDRLILLSPFVLIVILALCAFYIEEDTFAAKTSPDTNLISVEQEKIKIKTGKYKYEKTDTYETHEYVTPDGEPGYQIIYTDDLGVHSKGYGAEAAYRTYFHPHPEIVASST